MTEEARDVEQARRLVGQTTSEYYEDFYGEAGRRRSQAGGRVGNPELHDEMRAAKKAYRAAIEQRVHEQYAVVVRALEEAAEHLEQRPDLTEGDAAVSSTAREALSGLEDAP